MDHVGKYKENLHDLVQRHWDVEIIRQRLKTLRQNGFAADNAYGLNPQNTRDQILNRVQLRAEEYEYLSHSCSKGSALALMEAFGLGDWSYEKCALLPGIGARLATGIILGELKSST